MHAPSGSMSRTMTFNLRVAILALLWCCGAGCGPTYPACENDKHCSEKGEYCRERICSQCRESKHCPGAANDPCVTCQNGACGRTQGCCATKLDCGSGKKCAANRCVPECASAADCSDGQSCNDRGACVAKGQRCSSDADCGAGKRCSAGACVSADGSCQMSPIPFAFNEANLTSDAQQGISDNAACLKEKGKTNVTIEGHCDERGTDAYNLELGNRRARAVKRYLAGLLPGVKIRTVSYGKTRPVCTEATESCWERNRRAQFVAR